MKEILKYLPDTQKNMPMSIELFGISYCDGSYHIRRPNSPVTVIEYVEEGCGTVIENGRSYAGAGGGGRCKRNQ